MDANERTIADIGEEIRRDWRKVYFGAAPYLDAMCSREARSTLATRDGVRNGAYGADPMLKILIYFLSNANTWRGETARKIKAEIKSLL